MTTRIQFRRGTAAEWTAADPVLAEGEIGVILDSSSFKVGDGVTNFNALPVAFVGADDPRLADSRDPNVHADEAHSLDYLLTDGSKPLIGFLNESVFDLGTSGTTFNIDWSLAPIFTVTLDDSPTATFSNTPSSGGSIVLIVKQDLTGGRIVSWPAEVVWPEGEIPTLSISPNAVDVITFLTYDGGLTYLGFLSGLGFA